MHESGDAGASGIDRDRHEPEKETATGKN